ncbi:MAG: YceI family protein [Bacteroidales bacterium]|nr:YceI family protein [Bacteroidales bacterium]
MKKIFTSMMLLLAIAAGMSLVSCNKQKAEKKYTAEEQANKIDATGEAFIQELDLNNWKATADVVIPAILFLESGDVEIDKADAPEIETEESNVDLKNLVYTHTYTIDMSNAKGHYTFNAEGKGIKESGDFKDFQIAFSADNHNYVADVEFTNGDKTILVRSYEYQSNGYYDENRNWVNVSGMVEKDYTYLILPAKMTGYFTADNNKHFTVEGNLSYNGVADPREITDLKAVTINADLAVKAGDYAVNLSKLSLKGGTFDEAFTLRRNKKLLLELTSKATGLNIVDNPYPKSGEEEEIESEFPFACENAQVALDVLGQVQVKGNIKFNELYSKFATIAGAEPKNAEEANALLKQIEPYYNLNVYYDKGSVVQASVRAKAFENEEKEIDVTAVINFQDGTSQAVPEFFTAENFGKTYAALENLVGKVQEYIQSMVPAEE